MNKFKGEDNKWCNHLNKCKCDVIHPNLMGFYWVFWSYYFSSKNINDVEFRIYNWIVGMIRGMHDLMRDFIT